MFDNDDLKDNAVWIIVQTHGYIIGSDICLTHPVCYFMFVSG